MNFNLEKDAVNKLAIVTALAKKGDEGIVKLETLETGIKVSVFMDLETMLQTTVEADVTETGECVMKAFRLKNALHQYSSGCHMYVSNGHCCISGKNDQQSKVEISLLSTPFNPLKYDDEDTFIDVTVDGDTLYQIFSDCKTSYVGKNFDFNMPILSHTRIKFYDNTIQTDSVDVGRFTRNVVTEFGGKKRYNASVDITNDLAKKVCDIIKAFKLSDESIKIQSCIKTTKITLRNIVLIGRRVFLKNNELVTGKEDIFSVEDKPFHASIAVDELKQFCMTTHIISDDQGDFMSRTPVSVSYDGDMLSLKYETIDGNVYKNIPVKVIKDGLNKFKFNLVLKAFFTGISRFDGDVDLYVGSSSSLFLVTGAKKLSDDSVMKQAQLFSLVTRKL